MRKCLPGLRSPHRGGFTLIELLVAVTLLIMLLAGTSFIFDTTVRAMDETTAINEMTADSPNFYDALRKDVRGIETNSYLILGQRSVTGFASHRMNELGRSTTFRCDWMEFFTNTEFASTMDTNVLGQWARIFWGHGPRTGAAAADMNGHNPPVSVSRYATDWIIMRHQVLLLAAAPATVEASIPGDPARSAGIEAGTGCMPSWGHAYQQAIKSLYNRSFRWFDGGNLAMTIWFPDPVTDPLSVPMKDLPVHSDYVAFDETTYWQNVIAGGGATTGAHLMRFHVLPHCGTFRIQFAMAANLRAGPGGTINWQDPANLGRTVFNPGAAWPVLLKVTTQVFDPKDRVDKGRTFTAVVPVAR
jgi:prepilin-type N-terminal cleavage/methylation domain-containing protein